MTKKNIKTAIKIHASPERVWQILTNFPEHPNWNPFLTYIKGEVKEGNRIEIKIGNMVFKPLVLDFKANQKFRWLGHFLFKGLFDGEHSFHIEDHGDGTVTFRHEEFFSGLLVPLMAKKLETETLPGFRAMNQKLKELAEA